MIVYNMNCKLIYELFCIWHLYISEIYLLFGFYYNLQDYFKDWKKLWIGTPWKQSRLMQT